MTKILLVEDNEMNRDMLSRRLSRKGFEIVIAVDGKQGVEMGVQGGYDLILMDMSLPEIDGWEATRQIRATPAGATVPIIALTAHAMAGDREACLAAGMDDYISKPIRPSELAAALERTPRTAPSPEPTSA